MRALIFTEGGSQIGLGHISRCSSLYDELEVRGIEVEFIIYGDTNNLEIIEKKNYQIANWLSPVFLNEYIEENDFCIVDSYLANDTLYRLISERAKKSLFIDDNGRIEYPNGVVVNPSLSTKAVVYPNNDTNCYLLGHKYIILRKPFIKVDREPPKVNVNEILIMMGGTDIHNITPTLLDLLNSKYINITFNIVIGSPTQELSQIRNLKNVNLYEGVTAEEMKKIMLKSDIAITAAGQTIYELIATKTPFIPIKVIENQQNNLEGLKRFKLINDVLDYNDPSFIDKLELKIDEMMDSSNRKKLFNKYKEVIDGLGTKRIINALTRGGYYGV